jgi:quercetin dioxygenase-like cupin family protein
VSTPASAERIAHFVDPRTVETLNVLGPTVQFLTRPEDGENAPLIMRGTIPPDGVVPLHSHADPETFLSVSGEVEGLVESADGFSWVRIGPGDVFHVPGGAKHAWRNRSQEPAVQLIVTTARIGRFFREVGTRVEPGSTSDGPPSADAIEHFPETAERYGYWNATPEQNAEVGLPAASVS